MRPCGMALLQNTEYTLYHTSAGDANGFVSNIRTDPRTDRFSVAQSALWNGPYLTPKIDTLNPSNNKPRVAIKSLPLETSGFVYKPDQPLRDIANNIQFGDLFRNIQTGKTYYKDVDGIIRPGDGSRADLTSGEGCLPYTGATAKSHARRPIVLNRAFQSVGDMAYAFRDLPFKSLDFSSDDSADLGLLDVFCLYEERGVIAGQVSPNAAPAPVLKALLAGAIKKELAPASFLTDTEAGTLATEFVKKISSTANGEGPILDRGDMATALANIVVQGSDFPKADQANKNLREAAMRALASFSDTRTWDLFIDVVAQVGNLPPARTGAESFVVNGEKRYWLHLAIDRYTGKVIARQLEAVYE